jgi:Cd2+/Zn2+-exporting ATPase
VEEVHQHTESQSTFSMFLPAIISLVLLLMALAFDNYFPQSWFTGWVRIIWYIAAYIPVGLPVVKEAFVSIGKGEIFSEFLLMSIATIGAFAIGEYPEGVAVMLFYAVGEVFQTLAVKRAKANIKSLLDQRPDDRNYLAKQRSQNSKSRSGKYW